jgi:hypothetical protein
MNSRGREGVMIDLGIAPGRVMIDLGIAPGRVMIDLGIARRRARLALAALAVSLTITPAGAAQDATEAWGALVAGGHVALIRHGNAPGTSPGQGGDPPGFKVDVCTTQRNLDELGRAQAKALGEALRSRGVRVDRIRSSPWCRCLDTARLMAAGGGGEFGGSRSGDRQKPECPRRASGTEGDGCQLAGAGHACARDSRFDGSVLDRVRAKPV